MTICSKCGDAGLTIGPNGYEDCTNYPSCQNDLEQYLEAARELGRTAARNAAAGIGAEWRNPVIWRYLLDRLNCNVHYIDSFLPRKPDLSGEWADDPSIVWLSAQVFGEDWHGDIEDLDAICEAWEAGVDEAFEPACIDELRKLVN